MAKVTKVFTYQNGRQTFTVPTGYGPQVNYYMWGGGGGAGGDSGQQRGGNGSAGTYITGTFNCNPDDEIEVIVGGGGLEGRSLDSNKKIYSCTITGTASSGVGPTASYGFVNDPTKAVYPQYGGALTARTFDRWNAFMNAWAVSNLPSNRSGTEEVSNNIYFPEAGSYTLQVAGDNEISVTWPQGNLTFTSNNNFANGPYERNISVPTPGVYQLNYILTNAAGSSGNPAGAAIAITRAPLSSMGGGAVVTYPGNTSMKNIIWSTRFGPDVDVSNRVPLLYAPVVDFYQPQSSYDWGGVPEQCLAFVSDNTTWTEDELAKLNLNFNKVIPIGYPVTITGVGNIDQVCATGYYTFKRGQTWDLARYNWSGNPTRNNNMTGRGTGTPSNWTERQWYNDNTGGRSKNKQFCKWDLPVPQPDALYIVGYADGVIYNAPSQRGSDNVNFTVTSTVSQTWAGGAGGKSATNVNNKNYNYYGGYGGQIGNGQIAGGGGGGGGASMLIQKPAGTTSIVGLAIAGGGAGGGGAGPQGEGNDGRNDYEIAPQPNPNSIGAGGTGTSAFSRGGAGGGGGGGCDGGNFGAAAVNGNGSGGDGGYSGGSQVVPVNITVPTAFFVMVGRGGDGGGSGGGGGGGAVNTGKCSLLKYQYIQVGGRGSDKFEGDSSGIWWNDTTYVVAGPGGRGGSIGASWAKNGGGQPGGCISDSTATNRYGGSGGGGGTGTTKATASGGAGKALPAKPPGATVPLLVESFNNGGSSAGAPGYGPGGGGGAGGAGVNGTTTAGGNGGAGKTVDLGPTGKKYTLGGGGGAAAGYYNPGPYVGFGQAGGGDGSWGTRELEYVTPQTYTFFVPRNTTSLSIEGVGAGGGGGSGAARGAGGGGSGGYLPRTAFPVTFGQKVEITVGKGGAAAANGTDTVIKFFAQGNIPAQTITLQGGRAGSSNPSTAPAGGLGGTPNGRQGDVGGQNEAPNWYSGSGAGSPFGDGGNNGNVNSKTDKPGNGGRGAGGGGGWSGSYAKAGGLGGNGFVSLSWNGSENQDAQANTGSGGGGGFDGGGGAGGTGFVAIAYAGPPQFSYVVNRRVVPPIQLNGYTIHECYESGELVFQPEAPEGRIYRGSGIQPAGQTQAGYVPGVAVGGVGRDTTDVFPVSSSIYPSFLNTYGVWNQDRNSREFNRVYNFYVPIEASYDIQAYADNGGTVKIDGGVVINMTPVDRDGGSYWYKNGATATKKLGVGLHRLEINATNTNLSGAFGMTITQRGTSNIIFNSRTPPIPSGSPQGGSGLCILEFTGGEGTAKVKVDGGWRQIVGQWVKIDGTWRLITDSAVKINGAWASLFGARPISSTVNTNGFGGPPQPNIPTSEPGTSSGGGGGGGCKIICTALHEMGLMSDNIYNADQAFGEILREHDPEAYYGYVKWASVVVDWMEGSGPQCMFWIRDPERRAQKQREMAVRWAHRIATPWAQHMAYRMGAVDKDSKSGRWIMKTGLAISRIIGRFTNAKEPSKSVSLGYAMWAVFAMFYVMAGIRGE
jgi:hypothetical protein